MATRRFVDIRYWPSSEARLRFAMECLLHWEGHKTDGVTDAAVFNDVIAVGGHYADYPKSPDIEMHRRLRGVYTDLGVLLDDNKRMPQRWRWVWACHGVTQSIMRTLAAGVNSTEGIKDAWTEVAHDDNDEANRIGCYWLCWAFAKRRQASEPDCYDDLPAVVEAAAETYLIADIGRAWDVMGIPHDVREHYQKTVREHVGESKMAFERAMGIDTSSVFRPTTTTGRMGHRSLNMPIQSVPMPPKSRPSRAAKSAILGAAFGALAGAVVGSSKPPSGDDDV